MLVGLNCGRRNGGCLVATWRRGWYCRHGHPCRQADIWLAVCLRQHWHSMGM